MVLVAPTAASLKLVRLFYLATRFGLATQLAVEMRYTKQSTERECDEQN